MANFNVVGFDEVEKQLLYQSETAVKAVPKMLEAGAAVLVEEQRRTIGILFSRSGRSTGAMKDSIKPTKVLAGTVNTSIDVYPQGKDRKGVRNAEKGFVLEYGRMGLIPRNWMSHANYRADSKVHQVMLQVWEGMNK